MDGSVTSPQGLDQAGGFVAAMIGAVIAGLLGAWWLARRSGESWLFERLVLDTQSGASSAGTPRNHKVEHELTCRQGITLTEMRPSGRVEIDGTIQNARSNEGWMDQGVTVVVVGQFGGELEIHAAQPVDDIETEDDT